VRDVLESFRQPLQSAGIDLHVELKNGLFVLGDRIRLEQVMTNLLTNAIRYAPRAPLEVSLLQQGDVVVLRCQDHGEGIAQEYQARIFARFERLVRAKEISGLGLGLYISRQIVEGHGGSIRVESAIGKGACFIVEIPAAKTLVSTR